MAGLKLRSRPRLLELVVQGRWKFPMGDSSRATCGRNSTGRSKQYHRACSMQRG